MNDNNLIPGAHKLTVEEQSRGGKASAATRGLRSAIKRRQKQDPEIIEKIIDMLETKILDGDLKALEIYIELSGESPKQSEISLKKQELKIKKETLEKNNW